MIDLYYAPTPNGLKVRLFLEEAELPYRLKTVNLGDGEQFKPEFLAVSLNGKIPAIVDHEPVDHQPLAGGTTTYAGVEDVYARGGKPVADRR